MADEQLTWEAVQKDAARETARLRIPGGWVYLIRTGIGDLATHEHAVFVPTIKRDPPR